MNQRELKRTCTLERVAAVANLFQASWQARRGKSRRPDVEDWWLRREREITALRAELLAGTYQPGAYHFFEIHDPKRRLIAAAPFRDRVVHHALCNLMAPVLERRFIARSFSCQIGKGTTAARECCRQLANRHRYVLKCDVRKFFPNIDQAILREKLTRHIACTGILALVGKILDSYRTGDESIRSADILVGPDDQPWPRRQECQSTGRSSQSAPPPLFPGEDWLEASERPRGVPIGNLTSQLWGNVYLDDRDHWITETAQHGAYLRYTDDFLLFGDDKARLWDLHAGVRQQLTAARLKLAEPKSRLLATREGLPFCGFLFRPGLRPRILGATKRRFERRRYRIATWPGSFRQLSVSIFAWYQFSREGNSEGLRRAYVRWPLAARLKRRQRTTARVLRGASWNNNNPDNLLSSNRNNTTPDNRNNNLGFRVVLGVVGSSPKAEPFGEMRGGSGLPRRSQASSLTAVPAPVG